MKSRFRRIFSGASAIILSFSCPALAQVLPDLGSPVDRILEDSLIGDVERDIEASIEQLGESAGDVALPALGEASGLVSPVLKLGEDITRIPGIIAAVPGREIRLESFGAFTVVADEWVLLADEEEAAELRRLGAAIIEETPLLSSSGSLLILALPAEDQAREAIERRLRELGAESLDRNHVYNASSASGAADVSQTKRTKPAGPRRRLGLIDTDVDATHPALGNLTLEEQDFVTLGALRPQGHGTAVASILAAKLPEKSGVVRAASVFFLSEDGSTGATSASLIRALDWMLSEGVEVINFSLSGPPNKSLEKMIAKAVKSGAVIVAAVGNEGPAAGPLYPAAYEGVLGVTAVDAKGQVYRWANQGPFVDVAAYGVNVTVASPGGGVQRDSGTSLAAPQISAWLATRLPPGAGPDAALNSIQAAAQPAGGARDDATGWGILSNDQDS